jgi:hypothetical protein
MIAMEVTLTQVFPMAALEEKFWWKRKMANMEKGGMFLRFGRYQI